MGEVPGCVHTRVGLMERVNGRGKGSERGHTGDKSILIPGNHTLVGVGHSALETPRIDLLPAAVHISHLWRAIADLIEVYVQRDWG